MISTKNCVRLRVAPVMTLFPGVRLSESRLAVVSRAEWGLRGFFGNSGIPRDGHRKCALPGGVAPATADITVAHATADHLSLPGFQERFKGYRELPWSGTGGQSPLKQEATVPDRPSAGYSWR